MKKYAGNINFVIVVINKKKTKYTAEQIQEQFDTRSPVYFDESIAKICGVYSTPQAVIIDKRQHLFYRGNYNLSRYCTNRSSNFAELALHSLISNENAFQLDSLATKAYGCELPNCKK